MMKIYVPSEWNHLFGGNPSLYIDGEYIYDEKGYYSFSKIACGRIDKQKGEIYGSDYGTWGSTPIAYMTQKNGETIIYDKYPGLLSSSNPILCIKGDKIYAYNNQGKRGTDPVGYIENTERKNPEPERSKPKGPDGGDVPPIPSGGGGGGMGELGCFLFIVAFLAIGRILDEFVGIVSNPSRLLMFIGICIAIVLYGFLLAKLFFGFASLIKGEGFVKGFKIPIIKELKSRWVGWPKKEKTKAAPRSSEPKKAGPVTYTHTCVKCGKTFTDQLSHNPYCPTCRQQMGSEKAPPKEPEVATQTCKVCGKKFPANVNKSTGICMECTAKGKVKYPTVYTHHCPRCGKAYKSTVENPKSKYCDYCYQLIQKEKEEEGKNKIPKGSVYTHHCSVCGKAYISAEREPKDLRCESCKTVTKAPKPEEKKVFNCPVCGKACRVPAGKGRIVITCKNQECRNRFIVES